MPSDGGGCAGAGAYRGTDRSDRSRVVAKETLSLLGAPGSCTLSFSASMTNRALSSPEIRTNAEPVGSPLPPFFRRMYTS